MDAKSATYILSLANSTMHNAAMQRINRIVLTDPRFSEAPGGYTKHHKFKGGLLIHVAEVMSNVLKMTNGNASDALVTAVIWHDYLKIREYKFVDEEIKKLPYHDLVRHVAGSAMEFYFFTHGSSDPEFVDQVCHLLLSHHGRKEWGSPIEPGTAEAFILHAADMMSATGVNL